MKFRLPFALLFVGLFLSACTIQSDVILPAPVSTGDPIDGFPTDISFQLETFDTETKAFKPFARVTPVTEGAGIRYTMTIDASSKDRLELYASKMSDGNFLLRYASSDGVRQPSLKESGLAFLAVRDGQYYLLTSISKEETLRAIFPEGPLPEGTGLSDLRLETMDQAVAISAWFAQNYPLLAENKDYSQFRVLP